MIRSRRQRLVPAGITAMLATCLGLGAAVAAELDLREANVTAVDMMPAANGHRMSVTLHHDDAGESGYADQGHGYGGRAAIVDVASGRVELVRQGAEPTDFNPAAK